VCSHARLFKPAKWFVPRYTFRARLRQLFAQVEPVGSVRPVTVRGLSSEQCREVGDVMSREGRAARQAVKVSYSDGGEAARGVEWRSQVNARGGAPRNEGRRVRRKCRTLATEVAECVCGHRWWGGKKEVAVAEEEACRQKRCVQCRFGMRWGRVYAYIEFRQPSRHSTHSTNASRRCRDLPPVP